MIEKFPYTNLHELNLDWIIQQLIKIEQGAVLSVNGQTGEVVLYQDADVQLPDVVQPDGTWRFFRYVNGKPAGIKFDENGHAYMVDQYLTETEIYTERNQPDYPVESVNGQTGAVELYQQNGIRFPDVTENYWNIRREVDHNGSPSVEGLEFKDSQAMERISGQNRYKVYDEGNVPPYPVTSVNGQTGAVNLQFPVTSVNGQTGAVTIVIPVQSVNGQTGAVTIDPFVTDATSPIMAVYQVPANATQWGLLRQVKWGSTIDNKKVGIVFDTTGGVFNAYLRVDDGQTVTDLRILTPADIPSDTGVISVNGQSGVVILDATDIQMETGEDTRTVQTVVAGLELDMSQAFTDIHTVNLNQADGFSTSATYAVGDLVLHNDVLYKCIVAVTTAGAWNAANWQQTTLADELGGGDDNLAYVEDGSTASRNYNAGDYIIWQGTAYQASTAIGSGTTLAVGTNLTAITGGVANDITTTTIIPYVVETDGNMQLFKYGKIRVLSIDFVVYSQIRNITLDVSDRPSRVIRSTGIRQANDGYYATIAYIDITPTGQISAAKFDQYNGGTGATLLGDTDRLSGEVIWIEA